MAEQESSALNGRDEAVDGPAIAAAIIKRMPRQSQESLLEAIALSAPQIAKEIEDRMIAGLEAISDLRPQGIERLVREVDHRDLVIALRDADQNLTSAVLSSVSERKRQIITEDLLNLPAAKEVEIQSARMRIRRRLEELRTEGSVLSKPAHKAGTWA